MKSILKTAISVVLLMAFVACDSFEGKIWDISPVVLRVYVQNGKGENLLEQNWLDGKKVTATFKGETYELQPARTKYYMPYFYGFVLENWGNGQFLYFGELNGAEDINEDLIISWGDGTSETIKIYNDYKTKSNGTPKINRYLVVNGKKVDYGLVTFVKQ